MEVQHSEKKSVHSSADKIICRINNLIQNNSTTQAVIN